VSSSREKATAGSGGRSTGAVQLGADERRGYFVELLVEQLERASEWAVPEA
jgi:hypothetical protein